MSENIGELSAIADCILLDDISDVFYRSIVFPFILRTELDESSSRISEYDTKLQSRLSRHLYWADALPTLDPQVQRLCTIAFHIHHHSYTAKLLQKDREQDFWLQNAIVDVFGENLDSEEVINRLVSSESNYLGSLMLRPLVWRYLEYQTTEPCLSVMKRVQELTLEYRDLGHGIARSKGVKLSQEAMDALTTLHALPMMVLIKLYDRALFKLSVEYKKLFDDVFEPTAESLLDFLKFDEFIRPHIMESIGLSPSLVPSLLNLTEPNSDEMEYFILGRNATIKKLLVGNNVLTPNQVGKLEQQLGIEHMVGGKEPNNDYHRILSHLLKKR